MLILYMSFIDDEIHRRLFEKIYMTYRKQMFLVARAVLSNDSDAEDAVHDVFLKIAKSQMQKIGSIQEAADVRSYLLKATPRAAPPSPSSSSRTSPATTRTPSSAR